MKSFLKGAIAAATAIFFATAALALSTTVEQQPVPFSTGSLGDLLIQSHAVSGGTLYVTTLREPGENGPVLGLTEAFAPVAAGGLTRYLRLTDAKDDTGVALTATAGTTGLGAGIARTAGTSLTLVGHVTSSSAVTNKALWELDLPDSYVAGANVPVIVNANYTGAGSLTAASTTLTVAAYTEVNGAETALTVSAAQQFIGTAANYTFTITGTALTPGAHIAIEVVMLVTSASGANTGQINSVAIQG